MPTVRDGPASPLFEPLPFAGNASLDALPSDALSKAMSNATQAPRGVCTGWGIPFAVGRVLLATDAPVEVDLPPRRGSWIVLLHTADVIPLQRNAKGFVSPMRGTGALGEHAADYVLGYADGSEARRRIRFRHEIGMVNRVWGEACFEAVALRRPHPLAPPHEQRMPRAADDPAIGSSDPRGWGLSQTRVRQRDVEPWTSWLFAWPNPHPDRELVRFRVEPARGRLIVSAISIGSPSDHPLRWSTRKKALLTLPADERVDRSLDEQGLLSALRLDLGQVISAEPRFIYPNEDWAGTDERRLPEIRSNEAVVEYTAHADARFHFADGTTLAVAALDEEPSPIRSIAPASQRVRLRVLDAKSRKPVPVRLHAHGEAGEYLAPVDRHRIPNPAFFEDYGAECVTWDLRRGGMHYSTYISGATTIDLPLGRVFLEISKGFEVKPVRKVVRVTPSTRTITVTLENVLRWRERGWVTADTHVHFLSPPTARLEGAAEGVNVVNLLATQWGELMTNAGDFDGSRLDSGEDGDQGEWLVRVGSENRQHVLGHISLLGYAGALISPMASGGPDESALGDPLGKLLTEWARECRARGGIVVFPHFPAPRAENAATLVHGDVDAVEMCSIFREWGGIDPVSLSDWYRYLNCGYVRPCVGGTDKMAASTAVGTMRTYARIATNRRFTYESWKDAIRSGDTFVTCGPLLEFAVDGKPPGAKLRLGPRGGTLDVEWQVASVTVPMTRVELVVNGEIRESVAVDSRRARGHWSMKIERGSWLALLVRGRRPEHSEIIGAHSSPVVVEVRDSPIFSTVDAVTILEQIEGAIAYFDTLGTRADARARKRMRLVLTSAHRKLHNRMHELGLGHVHTPVHDHH